MQPVLEEILVDGYHKVLKVTEPESGLVGIIAIHDVRLGTSLGGIRIRKYGSFDEALTDVLRLSKGMTYKSAMLDKGFGGGKSVIIADPKNEKTPELLKAFGRAIESLGGEYIGAEDSGCTTDDMKIIREETSYLVGLVDKKSSGNPAPFTAWGVFRGIQAALMKVHGSTSLKGIRVAIQGVGSVGEELAGYLFWHGAQLILADINEKKVAELAHKYHAEAVSTHDILSTECDLLAPCALGGIINEKSIPHLQCRIVAGAANNQLLVDADADRMKQRDILYAPDYVINAGGLVNVVNELEPDGYNPIVSRDEIEKIYERLLSIFNIAEKNDTSTEEAAKSLAEYRLKYTIGKRETQLCIHH
ncbi:MAG: Glu/Leu/Phe/Val dehydrogenase dimerization domain-containing protein [Simkaniaceae bacterium]